MSEPSAAAVVAGASERWEPPPARNAPPVRCMPGEPEPDADDLRLSAGLPLLELPPLATPATRCERLGVVPGELLWLLNGLGTTSIRVAARLACSRSTSPWRCAASSVALSRSGGCIEKMTSSLAATSLGATAPSPLKLASIASHTLLMSTWPWLERQRCSGSTRRSARRTASMET